MKIPQIVSKLFTYTPQKQYEFNMPENANRAADNINLEQSSNEKIFSNLSKNLDYIKTSYNTLINSDIVIREFIINARNKQYNAFVFYIDGMIDTNIMNDFVLKPLMLRNTSNLYDNNQTKVVSEMVKNQVTIRKIKKFDISQYLFDCLMPQNSVHKVDNFQKIFSGVNSGNCALFIDTLNIAFDIEVKGFKQRSIDAPNNEVVIKGSQEAFVENIRTNTSILRRIINNENLIIENIDVGKITKTKCGICYIKNITNSDLVAEVKYRINNLGIDSLISSRRIRTAYF